MWHYVRASRCDVGNIHIRCEYYLHHTRWPKLMYVDYLFYAVGIHIIATFREQYSLLAWHKSELKSIKMPVIAFISSSVPLKIEAADYCHVTFIQSISETILLVSIDTPSCR